MKLLFSRCLDRFALSASRLLQYRKRHPVKHRVSFCYPKLVGNVGEKRHLASSLDRGSELSLVKSAVAANTSGEDLCSLGNELSELCNVLVIDLRNLVLAEDANLLSSVVLAVCGTLSIVSIHFR